MGEKEEDARRNLDTAKEMIGEMGYHRRDKDVREIEEKYEIPVIDSISATVWYSLKRLNKDASAMAEEWGSLFNC